MPLPTNGSFSVLGYSKPGEAVISKPKQAMIVRMSPETLDALQAFPNHPAMEFQFGPTPGIFIGEIFFPMAPSKETTPHDLYLRASSASRKTPPFKLHANVVGKFTVQRELAPSVGEKVRESTNEAANKKASRTAIMIDNPSKLFTNQGTGKKQKKKEIATSLPSSATARNSSLSEKTKSNAIASTSRANPTSNPISQLSAESASSLRKRLIHFLATEERAEEQVVKAVGGPNCSAATRQIVCQVLNEVGEAVGKSGGKEEKRYRLKPRSWTEVRPYEWPKWGDTVRTRICREARIRLKDLGISESDPVWNHVTYRKPNTGTNGVSSSSTSAGNSSAPNISSVSAKSKPTISAEAGEHLPRRGISSHEVQKKMTSTSRAKPKGEILMKDEGSKTTSKPREDNYTQRGSRDSNDRRLSNAVRKQPGSGLGGSKPAGSSSGESTSRKMNDMRPPARDRPSNSSSSQAPAARPPRQKPLVEDANPDTDLERRKQRLTDRELSRIRQEREGEYSDGNVSLKRKQMAREDGNDDFEPPRSSAPQKRRKTEAVVNTLPSKPRKEERESNRPRPSDVESLRTKSVKREREASPLVPPPANRRRPRSPLPSRRPVPTPDKISPLPSSSSTSTHASSTHASGSKGSKPNGNSKLRRRSPIYTSSEDEDELPQTKPRAGPSIAPPPPPPNVPAPPLPPSSPGPVPPHAAPSHQSSSRISSSRPRPAAFCPYPTDRASLRAKYNASYAEYLGTMHKLIVQRGKLESMLRDHDAVSSGSIDSDGDIELLGPEDLTELAADHKQKHDELVNIRRAYLKSESGGTGGSSD